MSVLMDSFFVSTFIVDLYDYSVVKNATVCIIALSFGCLIDIITFVISHYANLMDVCLINNGDLCHF